MLRLIALGLLFMKIPHAESVGTISARNVDPADVDYQNATTVLLDNVKINEIPKNYFRNLNLDLSLLRITHSHLLRIDERAFDGLDHLNRLELSNNGITHIEPKTFARLNGLEMLSLSSNKLRNVSLVLNHIQEIVLARNRIENLREDFITGDNSVTFIDLSLNSLKKLEHSMKNLVKLSSINIANNQISEIAPEVFRDNEHLASVYASGNKLTTTEGLRLNQLKTLDMSWNKLWILDEKSFANMSFLDELVLNGNQITELRNPFTHTKNLQILGLSDNFITEVDPDVFKYNTYLSKLLLSKNRIKSLKPFGNDLRHLTVLDLSHNNLESIHPDFFKPIDKLETLDLSFNRLTNMGDLLTPLTSLASLDLSSNLLRMDRNMLKSNVKLTKLNLSSNGLDMSLSDLSKNGQLQFIDLSRNKITNFCDMELSLYYLSSIDLSYNKIKELSCFKNNDLLPFATIDIRKNPLTCDSNFDDVIAHFILMQTSPFRVRTFDIKDVHSVSRRSKTTLDLWNSVKHELCPNGLDIHINVLGGMKDTSKEEGHTEVSYGEMFWQYDYYDDAWLSEDEKEGTVAPGKDVKFRIEVEERSGEIGQSERESWDTISKVENIAQEYDDGLSNAFSITKSQMNVFTITLIFIGVALILILANAIIFMFIRMRGWKNEFRGEQKYTHLENKVYKDTTVPNDYSALNDKKSNDNYRIYCSRMLTSMRSRMGDDDSESVKKMIVDNGIRAEV